MTLLNRLLIALLLILPINSYAGTNGIIGILLDQTDIADFSISGYYDLRDRKSLIQVTNVLSTPITIHVQIFQNDSGCDELDFNDTLTGNDTVVYDMDNIIKNNGTPAPINLNDNSDGYVVVTLDNGDGTFDGSGFRPLIGNFRIIDDSGYEYRTNMSGITAGDNDHLYAHFNTADGANQADLVGYTITYQSTAFPIGSSTVLNRDQGTTFDVFVYDMVEEPLSCDSRNFACGNIMNYGINEDYGSSKGTDLICQGGGLANSDGGYVLLVNGRFPVSAGESFDGGFTIFHGFIGLNNGNGTGSMDALEGDGESAASCNSRGACRVFITSELFNGVEVGGGGSDNEERVMNADQICQRLADASPRTQGGTYFAWIGTTDPDINPAGRFNQATVPYVLVDDVQTKVADNWPDLIDCTEGGGSDCLENWLWVDEMGATQSRNPWTGVNADGTSSSNNCDDWSQFQAITGDVGNSTSLDSNWTNLTPFTCQFEGSPLYCFEQ
ncbi:MAG: hypothetical protein GTO02_03230 [Candidatus Dadabacteria bacterium]|nr:hypothetical protein [Candidatus Dadabacteria bacterium]NIQ13441.1 hypothetical protein [Candidatus Dadabacteria bacterium]